MNLPPMLDAEGQAAVNAAEIFARPFVTLLDDVRAAKDAKHCPRYPTTADAREAVLVLRDGELFPAIQLEDRSVLVLSRAQVRALQRAFEAWGGMFA